MIINPSGYLLYSLIMLHSLVASSLAGGQFSSPQIGALVKVCLLGVARCPPLRPAETPEPFRQQVFRR